MPVNSRFHHRNIINRKRIVQHKDRYHHLQDIDLVHTHNLVPSHTKLYFKQGRTWKK